MAPRRVVLAGRAAGIVLGPGQGPDGRALPDVLEQIHVPRAGVGRARTRPTAVLGDKAYSSRAIRTLLRKPGIRSVIS